jgi:hypothetical protein
MLPTIHIISSSLKALLSLSLQQVERFFLMHIAMDGFIEFTHLQALALLLFKFSLLHLELPLITLSLVVVAVAVWTWAAAVEAAVY